MGRDLAPAAHFKSLAQSFSIFVSLLPHSS